MRSAVFLAILSVLLALLSDMQARLGGLGHYRVMRPSSASIRSSRSVVSTALR